MIKSWNYFLCGIGYPQIAHGLGGVEAVDRVCYPILLVMDFCTQKSTRSPLWKYINAVVNHSDLCILGRGVTYLSHTGRMAFTAVTFSCLEVVSLA